MDEGKKDVYILCNTCSHPILMSQGLQTSKVCERCGTPTRHINPLSTSWSLAFTLTALIFYIPANIYPFMTIELYGSRNSSTIWDGIISLVDAGSWPIALIVLLASIVIPFLKIMILFYLGLTASTHKHAKFKTRLYKAVEVLGRWSMLDIFLLAVLVAIMKLGPWTTVRPEPGALWFVLVVIFTIFASQYFDPKLLWEKEND